MTNAGSRAPSPARASIVPFWNRLGEISRYPTHSAALTTILVLALCRLVGLLPLGIVGWLLQMLIWVALYKYAFECLRATADGRLEPPEIAVSVDDSLGWSQIWLQVAFFVLNVFGFWLLGPVGGTLVAIVLAIALPAAIMSLAMDENLAHALNPATWFAVIARLGGPYFAVAGLYFLFGVSQHYAQAMVLPFLPAFLSVVALAFITNYVVVATFHLMGYLIYQYHDEVGYEPGAAQAAVPARSARADPDQRFLDEAAQLVRDGKPETACDMLSTQLRGRGGSANVHAQYRKLLALLGRREEQLRHGREWITILLVQDDERRAADVARECIELDPAFEPNGIPEATRLAHKAVALGAAQVALKLVSAAYKRDPKHPDVPRNSLLAAKLLAERMGKDDTARKLLDRVLQDFPQDPLADELRAYRAFLDRIGKPAPAAT